MTEQSVGAIIVAGKGSLLDAVPLELRYKIYGFASQRSSGPYLMLKEYLEKKDPDIEPLAPPAISTLHTNNAGDEEEEEEEEEEEDTEMQEDEDIEEEEGESEPDGENEGQEHEEEEIVGQNAAPVIPPATAAVNMDSNSGTTTAATPVVNYGSGDDDEDEDMDEQEEHNRDDESEEPEHDDENDDSEEDEDEDDEDEDAEENEDDGTTGLITAPPPPPPTGRNTKYRHILSTIRLSHCPPPLGLLLTCSQLRNEALNDFLNTCSLDIRVSRSFQHQSFFLETIDQLARHPFSPLEQMRKVNLSIVWDSEWFDSKLSGSPPELETSFFFEFHLEERIQKIVELLNAAPELRSVTVNWYDSDRTATSEAFMNEKLVTFLSLADKELADPVTGAISKIDVSCTEHFAAAGTAHATGSSIRRLRNEFEALLATGMSFR